MSEREDSRTRAERQAVKLLIDLDLGVCDAANYRKTIVALALSNAHFEGACEVWAETYDKMYEVIMGKRRVPPPPPPPEHYDRPSGPSRPPDPAGSTKPSGSRGRRCWWCARRYE